MTSKKRFEKPDIQEAYDKLVEGLKRKSFDSSFKKHLLKTIEEYKDEIKVIRGKFKFDKGFIKKFIEVAKLDDKKLNSIDVKEYKKREKEINKNFNRLIKYELINKGSSSFTPRVLSIISINPNPKSLIDSSFSKIDEVKKIIDELKSSIEHKDHLEILYIYLRLFHQIPFSKKVLSDIYVDDILKIDSKRAIFIVYEKSFLLKNVDRYRLPYRLFLLDEFASALIYDMKISNDKLFNDIDLLEDRLKIFKKEKLKSVSMFEIKNIVQNIEIFNSSSFKALLRNKTLVSVGLTLAEIDKLFPNVVPDKLIDIEKERIKTALKRPRKSSESNVLFDISELEELNELLKQKDNFPTKEQISRCKNEIKVFKSRYNSKHLNSIYDFLLHLLSLLNKDNKKNQIRLSTFRNYVGILNKHLFTVIEDFADIKREEIETIINRFEKGSYKKSSIRKSKMLINRFFNFLGKNGFDIDVYGSFYPKSLIFEDELDDILEKIENEYKKEYGVERLGKIENFMVMQLQALVLLGFYTGLRLNEARTLQFDSIYIYDDAIFVDIDSKGLKIGGKRLKTLNAKRRVKKVIKNKNHLEFLKNWLKNREEIKSSKNLFLEKSKYSTIKKKMIDENYFMLINRVIKDTTKRYATFHSLRHSYVTYSIRDILVSDYPYELLELSVTTGHETPDTTLKSYCHADLLFLMKE